MELVHKTIGGCLKETASRIGQQTAIEFEDWTCTWSELDEVTDLLAARFMTAYGIQKGTHAGIWSQNSPAFAQAVLALYKIGATVVVLNAANSVDEMIDQLDRADVEVVFYGSGARNSVFDEMIPRIRKNTPKVRYFLHIEEREAGKWLLPGDFSERSRKDASCGRDQREPEEPSVRDAGMHHIYIRNDIQGQARCTYPLWDRKCQPARAEMHEMDHR